MCCGFNLSFTHWALRRITLFPLFAPSAYTTNVLKNFINHICAGNILPSIFKALVFKLSRVRVVVAIIIELHGLIGCEFYTIQHLQRWFCISKISQSQYMIIWSSGIDVKWYLDTISTNTFAWPSSSDSSRFMPSSWCPLKCHSSYLIEDLCSRFLMA